MSYKTYENYKDSGLNWIGQVPTHWETHRIKDFLNFKIGGTPSTSNESYFEGENIWVSISDLNNNKGEYIIDSSIKISDEAIRASNVKLISKGSLLYSFKLSVGLTAFAGCELYTNEAIASFEPNEYVDLNFLKYIFKVDFENNAVENIYGAKLFNTDLIKFAKFAMPKDVIEQKKIACFLDNKIVEINYNINKNEELISLLEEKKAALINQVVTNGLNHEVPMKDTGITWIGKIPQHWEIFNLNYFFNVTKLAGFEFSEYMEYIDNGEIIALRALNIKNNKLDLSNIVKISKSVSDKLPRSKLYKGDLIFSYVGTVGEVAIIDDDNTYHLAPNIAKISSKSNNINISYFLYYLSSLSGQREIKNNTSKTTQEVISMAKIRKLRVICPNLTEQDNIVSYLDKRISKIDKTIEKVQENIDLLNEYKASLIYHVVTGKIDVRDEV